MGDLTVFHVSLEASKQDWPRPSEVKIVDKPVLVFGKLCPHSSYLAEVRQFPVLSKLP